MSFITESRDSLYFSQSELGGKAWNLRHLSFSGFNVPTWSVVSSTKMTQREEISAEDKLEINNWLQRQQKQGHCRFIVRSSMVGEDGLEKSFAGMLESYPNLITADDIAGAIIKCGNSVHSERVRKYINTNTENLKIAVILQVMIDGEKSGVLFTANPNNANREEFLISATYGACEAVVGGQFNCDEYQVSPAGEVTQQNIAVKENCLQLADTGLVSTPVKKELVNVSCLNAVDIKKIAEVGRQATQLTGLAMDLEWTMAGGQLHVLQMRPITNLGKSMGHGETTVFDNSNIQESFNGLTLPLTFSYASEAYYNVYRQMMVVMGFSNEQIRAHDHRHHHMLGLVKGRVYYNIKSWYQGLLFLPSFGRNKQDMEAMMGLEEPVEFVEDQKLSTWQKLQRTPQMLKLVRKLIWRFIHIEKSVKQFRQSFADVCHSLHVDELTWQPLQKIMLEHDRLKQYLLENWTAPIVNDFYVMIYSGKIRRTLKKINLEEKYPDLLASEELESVAPVKLLVQIAQQIRAIPQLKQASIQLDDEELWFALRIYPEIKTMLDTYIEKYADRVAGELKLETITLRQDKSFLLKTLRAYVLDSKINLTTMNEKQQRVRLDAEQLVFSRLKKDLGYFASRGFKNNLKKFRQAVAFREAMRLDRTKSFGMFRQIYLIIGKKLFAGGLLEDPRDIFYLTTTEVREFIFGKAFFDEPKELVQLRKKQYAKWQDEEVASHIHCQLPGANIQNKEIAAESNSDDSCFSGTGCYPGIIEGEVVLVKDPNNTPDLKNKIIVAERTDPGWTPLFMQIKGLIVEKGSQLSHSAVVAREMALPTVVGIKSITKILKTGQRVQLNGSTGQITIVNSENNEELHHGSDSSPTIDNTI